MRISLSLLMPVTLDPSTVSGRFIFFSPSRHPLVSAFPGPGSAAFPTLWPEGFSPSVQNKGFSKLPSNTNEHESMRYIAALSIFLHSTNRHERVLCIALLDPPPAQSLTSTDEPFMSSHSLCPCAPARDTGRTPPSPWLKLAFTQNLNARCIPVHFHRGSNPLFHIASTLDTFPFSSYHLSHANAL